MTDNANQPSPEQVEAANKAEDAKWQDDFDQEKLDIPYKHEDDKDAAKSKPDDNANKASDGNSGEGGDGTKPVHTEDTEYEEPAPTVTAKDPGDYVPADYSFEVTLKDGKTVKISTPEEADKLAENEDSFETAKQLLDFMRKSTAMATKLERDKEKYDADKQTFQEQLDTEQQRRDTVNSIASEFSYLVTKGLLPKVDPKYESANWSDPDVAKQPGVKEQLELLNYMAKENQARTKAGVKPLGGIVDAYNAWKLENKASDDERRAEGEARKAASARVAPSSPAQQGSYVPKGIAVGRTDVLKRGGAKQWDD